jgi:chaperonin GroEL
MVFRPDVQPTLCFVLMPFKDPHPEYFAGIIAPAANDAGLTAIKADDIYGTAPIIHDIWDQIWKARAVIADVTDRNPNVNYELGICHSLGVPTVLITQDIDDVPFDYRHRRCIVYDTRRVDWQEKLAVAITRTLKALLTGLDRYEDLHWPYDTSVIQSLDNVGKLVPAEEGTDAVVKGGRIVRDWCARAFGPNGTNVSVSPAFGDTRFDRSGLAIAAASSARDALQQKGIEQTRRLANEMYAAVGDGSKTAILIFQEMVEAGRMALSAGTIPRDLIHEMDVSVEMAVRELKSMARPPGSTDLGAVARTAAAGDREIGRTIEEALSRTGPDGIVSLLETNEPATSVDVREGIYFDRGFLSSRFITDEARQVAELSESYILIYDSKISSMMSLLPLLENVARMSVPLAVIAADVEGEALETLAVNKERGVLKCLAVRAPILQGVGQVLLEDIAVATGGTVISSSSTRLENVTFKQLGRARRIEATKDTCWISGGHGDSKLIQSRAAALRQQIELEKSDYDIEKVQLRLAMLVGKVFAIRVGGASALDRAERMYKMQTAMHSGRAAVSSGVVPGGGTALSRAARGLSRDSSAAKVVVQSLEAPLKQQIANARVSEDRVLKEMEASADDKTGFEAESRRVADLEKAGVLDATKLCTTALELAFVHARAVLQTGVWDLTDRTPERPTGRSRGNA